MSKKNWTEGAGATQNKKSDGLTSWDGSADAGEKGGLEFGAGKPAHLASDTTLQSYVSDVQKEYEAEYTDMFGDSYHGGNNYPSVGSKSKQGMD